MTTVTKKEINKSQEQNPCCFWFRTGVCAKLWFFVLKALLSLWFDSFIIPEECGAWLEVHRAFSLCSLLQPYLTQRDQTTWVVIGHARPELQRSSIVLKLSNMVGRQFSEQDLTLFPFIMLLLSVTHPHCWQIFEKHQYIQLAPKVPDMFFCFLSLSYMYFRN